MKIRPNVEIAFRTKKLTKTFDSAGALQKAYGKLMAETIINRLVVLKNAQTLSRVPTTKPERCHRLKGERANQYAVDLGHPYRLIFEPTHDPIPRKGDGGTDTDQITTITIIEVVDYH